MQIQLTGFLDKDTASFCKELWGLCLSAQSSPQGVPKELLEAKKAELMQEKVHDTRGALAAPHTRRLDRSADRFTRLMPKKQPKKLVPETRGKSSATAN